MKLAISGKGGTGKTTLAALLARALAEAGRPVLAVDADPAANLGAALGLPRAEWPEPISSLRELIRRRTGSAEGYGSFFKLNPEVSDLPEKYSRLVHGVRLLTLGGVAKGGGGCICPESALLKALVTHILLQPGEVVILDMEAGIEHLGRGTAQAVSLLAIVVEPGQQSIETARTIARLAGELRLPRLGVIINKLPPGLDPAPLLAGLEGLPLLGTFPLDPEIARADLEGRSPWTGSATQRQALEKLLAAIAAPVPVAGGKDAAPAKRGRAKP